MMQKMTIIWGITMVMIFAALTTFGFIYTNRQKDYKALEEKLAEAAKKYGEEKFLYKDVDDYVDVSFNDLKEAELIDDLKIEKDECTGYARISKNNYVFEYHGYIKCDKYTSNGY